MVRFLVHSKLDYRYVVCGSVCQLVQRQLDPIHHQGLHIVFRAVRTSPAQKLYNEARKLSLASCHLKLALNYVLKLKSWSENPAYCCVFEPENVKLFEKSASRIPPLGIRILPHLENSKINLQLIDGASCLDIAPTVRSDLTKKKKKDATNHETYTVLFAAYYRISFQNGVFFVFFSTDSSKTEEGFTIAAVSTEHIHKPFTCQLPDDSSIFTAELQTILLALKHVYFPRKNHFWCCLRLSFTTISYI